jgi:hypothetical protein
VLNDLFAGPTLELAKQRARLAGQAIESLVKRHGRGTRSRQLSAGRGDQSG